MEWRRRTLADVGGHEGGLGGGGGDCGTWEGGRKRQRGEKTEDLEGRTRMASSSESGNVSAMSTNEQASRSTRIAPRKLVSPFVEPPGERA